jgi:deoxyhypusine synthase
MAHHDDLAHCPRKLSHGAHDDALDPVVPLDLGAVHDFDELTRAMARTAFGGRQLGEAVDVVVQMARDPDCRVVLTLSGAMTVRTFGWDEFRGTTIA